MDSTKGKTSEVFRRKRIMLLLLPVILIPLMTLGFYALGGGKEGKGGKGIALTKGLNMSLPDPKFDPKKKGLNKLGFYKQSEQDSMRLRERRKKDPYYQLNDSGTSTVDACKGGMNTGGWKGKGAPGGLKVESSATDTQAGELMRKLELLKGVLSRQQQGTMQDLPLAGRVPGRTGYPGMGLPAGPAVSFSTVPARVGQGDPDLDKLNTLMDKVLRVRYPGDASLRDTLPMVREEKPAVVLSVPVQQETMTTLALEDKEDMDVGFIDLDEGNRGDSLTENMIAAVVDGAQTVISGEAVTLRTAGDAMLGGIRVPRWTSLSGKATLAGERLLVTVDAVRLDSRVIPVSLEVLDMDGMKGIRVKGSINRDVSKESADEAVSSLGIASVDASVAGQATAAGLQAAKTLLSRKIRLVRVGLPAGYKVLLKNAKSNR